MNTDLPIGYIASNGAWLTPADSLGHAVEMLEQSSSGAVPVLEGGSLCGLVSDREIARGLSSDETMTVGDVMIQSSPMAPAGLPVRQGLALLAETDFPALPIATPDGRFIGTVGRSELLQFLYRRRRPKSVGGMATPLGVYLSDGTFRGGTGDLGLALTGVFLFVGSVVASLFAGAVSSQWRTYGPRGVVPADWVSTGAFLLAFALWFRLSWLAGFHAAEHQTVHAIERNEPLTVERVAMMPRPHPRCGTNLVVLFSMFSTLYGMLHVDPLVAGIFSLVVYRFLGHWVQLHITTRKATRRQLRNGIAAGEQLLERFQNGALPARFGPLSRIWNMGLLQVAAGNLVPMMLLIWAAPHVPFVRWLLSNLQ